MDKRIVFENGADFNRFTELLYLSNSTETIDRGRIQHLAHAAIFSVPRGDAFVSIGAYCLMRNHPHLLLRENIEGGISKFMHKVFTGYTMYFNIKRKRVGNLFVTPFRSKHITNDRYLQRVARYIHLNPAEVLASGWKKGGVKNLRNLERELSAYPYSSLQDYFDKSKNRPEKQLLDLEAMELLGESSPLADLLSEASAYYEELSGEFGKYQA
ncbi:MAG: transposase [bacterium]|nr:transposase [bacterium]